MSRAPFAHTVTEFPIRPANMDGRIERGRRINASLNESPGPDDVQARLSREHHPGLINFF